MKATGKILKIVRNPTNLKYQILLEVDESVELEKLDNIRHLKKLDIELKKYYEKRGRDANAYCWVLVSKLATEMELGNLEVYRKAIREAGVYDVLSGESEAIERFERTWEKHGDGWFCERIESRITGEISVRAYYGSSSYNTKEMSRLLSYLIADCKALNIETLRKEDIESLLKEWEGCNHE